MDDSTDPAPRRTPLPRWTVPAVAGVALLLGAAVLVLLWRWIDGLPFADTEKRASAHIEALKVASGIVIGGGGLFALYLAARRQRTQELELEVRRIELAQRDRVQVHAEQVADDARQDAVERRVTDLYTKAADQLGSDKAPVRLAGLYALERLGQGNPDHRQTVIDVVCAYLRMPYTPRGTSRMTPTTRIGTAGTRNCWSERPLNASSRTTFVSTHANPGFHHRPGRARSGRTSTWTSVVPISLTSRLSTHDWTSST